MFYNLLEYKILKTMAEQYINCKGHAMMMLRLSHATLEQLQRYRGKSTQTINVNYNTLIQAGGSKNGG